MGRLVAGVGLQGLFEKSFGFFELALGRVKHAQVVVGLGLFGMGFGDFFEGSNGLVKLPALGLNHALHELPLHIGWRFLFLLANKLLGVVEPASFDGRFDGSFGLGLRLGGRLCPNACEQTQQDHRTSGSQEGLWASL